MRIHSDTLTRADITDAILETEGHVTFDKLERHGSRKRDHSYDVHLEGFGSRHTRKANSGTYGADAAYAATWDDWGWFMAGLFRRDPECVMQYDASAAAFHERTNGKFAQPRV